MTTIVSEFTTQLTAGNSLPGIIAIGFLIALLLEVEIIRAHDQSRVNNSLKVFRTALVPLAMVFIIWMTTRFIDLIY